MKLPLRKLLAVEKTGSTFKRFTGIIPRVWLAFALCFLGVALAGLTLAGAGSAGWAVIASPNASDSVSNTLEDVACVSASDCWGVGNFYTSSSPLRTLTQHWDGASWSVVPSPNVVATGNNQHNQLLDVACSSASECWAVGTYRDQEIDRTLILRWDGNSWSIIPSPNASSQGNLLAGVTCTSANDCWAVGGYYDAVMDDVSATLIQRWNGTAWSIVPSPNYSSGNPALPAINGLSDVTCTSASDCWAVGGYKEVLQPGQTLIARWNGAAWSLVPSPNSRAEDDNGFGAVTCSSASDCWAVGSYFPEGDPEFPRTFISRWNGTAWTVVPSGEPGRGHSLSSVTCPAPSECWAVGSHIERWNGSSWSLFPSPAGGRGVTCSSTAECWSVSQRSGAGSFRTLILRYTRAAATAPAQLQNISTRLRVQTGDNVLIGGFIVTGSTPKRILLRAIGPSLSINGAPVPGRLMDPTLELRDEGGRISGNNNWKNSPQRAEIEATGIPPTHNREAAIIRDFPPGTYTAIVGGVAGTTGIGLIEAYEIGSSVDAQMANISTRGFVETADNVMIGGFILGPQDRGASTIVVRALGPSLSDQGVSGALKNPTLALYDENGALLAQNDDWKQGQRADLEATGIAPTDDRESAIVKVLGAGNYTAIVRGRGKTTGVGLVEIYNLGPP